jgi:thiamine biosynthesis lipoprotein
VAPTWLRAAGKARPVFLHRWRGIAMGAEVAIELGGREPEEARAALAACRAEVVRLEGIFSLHDERSALARLNRAGRLEEAPPELFEVIGLARRFSEASAGAFDLSVQPLCELALGRGAAATAAETARAAARVGYRAIEADARARTVRLGLPGMKLTCNGVAQGYATDRVTELLRQRGFGVALVDLGEGRALGGHPEGRPWRVGVENPARDGWLAGVLEVRGRALSTSGGYGRRSADGARHHLVDARSGACREEFASVTAVADTAAEADALSTCVAVLPREAAVAVARTVRAAELHVIERAGGALRRLV